MTTSRRTLLVLLLIYAISHVDRQLVAILIEPIKRELALTDTAAGLLYGFAFAVFFSVLGIPIARLADRTNRSRIVTLSLVLFSAMTALSAWVVAYWQLVLARTGVGIGEAGTGPASHSIIADLYPVERRGIAMAVFATGAHLGILLGFLGGGFLGLVVGWRATFVIAGAAGILLAWIATWGVKEPRRMNVSGVQTQPVTVVQALRALWQCASMRHLPLGPVELFAKVGYYFYDVEINAESIGSLDDSNEDLVYGAGLGVTLFEHLHARLEYEIIDVSEVDDANALWLSGAWRF